MAILFLAVLIGLLPAAIASSKGRNFFLWWLYGAAIWIVAFPHALLLKPDRQELDHRAASNGLKKCPHCAEMIREEARICRYCQRDQAIVA
jgi:hypothetical protein